MKYCKIYQLNTEKLCLPPSPMVGNVFGSVVCVIVCVIPCECDNFGKFVLKLEPCSDHKEVLAFTFWPSNFEIFV